MRLLGASRDDGDRSAHRLVPGAAKNVAKEGERTDLVGHKTHPGDLARNDVRPNVEVGCIEAHEDIGRGELQNDRDALLQAELVGRIGESPGQYLDDLLLGLRGGTQADRRCPQQQSAQRHRQSSSRGLHRITPFVLEAR